MTALLDRLQLIAGRIPQVQDQVQTEEACKTALVLPFIQALGYDVFNPAEVVPEFTADVGIKRGEKVDYAICCDGQPLILVECKCCGADLGSYSSQLYRYFSVTPARVAILTDGVRYRFYSDLHEPNKLDDRPFLELNLLQLRGSIVEEVAKLSRGRFDLEEVLASAAELRYLGDIRAGFAKELAEPSDDFVRHLAAPVYAGKLTQRAMDRFRVLVKRSMSEYVTEQVERRLEEALSKNRGTAGPAQAPDGEAQEEPAADNGESRTVETTVEEMQGYYIVKAVLGDMVDVRRIAARDVRTYFGVLLDDNNRKPICRLWLNGGQKYLGVFDAEKNETRIAIADVEDIFGHAAKLRESLGHQLA